MSFAASSDLPNDAKKCCDEDDTDAYCHFTYASDGKLYFAMGDGEYHFEIRFCCYCGKPAS